LNNTIHQFEYRRILVGRKRIYSRFQARGFEVLMFLLFLATTSLLLFPNVPMIQPHETSFIAVLVLIVQAVLNLVLLLRTLTRATSIAGRERTSAWNWEAFVLTAVDADTVIIGKWAAVVRSLWREFLWLGILRGLSFPVAIMLYQIHGDYPYLRQGRYFLADFIPVLPTLLFVIVAIAALTFAQLPLMSAIGVLAASRRAHQPVNVARAFSTWLLIMLGTSVLIASLFFVYNQYVFDRENMASRIYYSWLAVDSRVLETTILGTASIADTGIFSPALLTTAAFYAEPPHWSRGLIFGLVLAIYAFWTWAALRLSIWLSRWQGMTKANR
jgi:hypothetical protein